MSEHPKKQQLLELIRANPFISQQELATSLGLSRPAVANYIAGLIRERKLLGRAYMLPDRRPVVDVFCSDTHYRDLFDAVDLRVLDTAAPLASGEESVQWVSETTISPWIIYVLGKEHSCLGK